MFAFKFLIACLALLHIFPCVATAQATNIQAEQVALQAIYSLVYQPSSLSKNEKREDFILSIGKSFSRFQSMTIQKKDSILNSVVTTLAPENMQITLNILSSLPRTQFRYRIYKFYSNNKVQYIDEIESHYYENSNDISAFKWLVIPKDTMMISGYHCQRATTSFAGRNYDAWFTKEIPVSDGPYRFCGLPGLIIKISDSTQRYSFTLTNLRRILHSGNTLQPFKRLAAPATTLEIYKGQRQELSILKDGQSGSGIKLSEERKADIARTLKEYDTRIELE